MLYRNTIRVYSESILNDKRQTSPNKLRIYKILESIISELKYSSFMNKISQF